MGQQNSYTKNELIEMSAGKTFGKENAKLPQEPMLMVDRILNICENSGKYGRGEANRYVECSPPL